MYHQATRINFLFRWEPFILANIVENNKCHRIDCSDHDFERVALIQFNKKQF